MTLVNGSIYPKIPESIKTMLSVVRKKIKATGTWIPQDEFITICLKRVRGHPYLETGFRRGRGPLALANLRSLKNLGMMKLLTFGREDLL